MVTRYFPDYQTAENCVGEEEEGGYPFCVGWVCCYVDYLGVDFHGWCHGYEGD